MLDGKYLTDDNNLILDNKYRFTNKTTSIFRVNDDAENISNKIEIPHIAELDSAISKLNDIDNKSLEDSNYLEFLQILRKSILRKLF